jgi:hypothetical protein
MSFRPTNPLASTDLVASSSLIAAPGAEIAVAVTFGNISGSVTDVTANDDSRTPEMVSN